MKILLLILLMLGTAQAQQKNVREATQSIMGLILGKGNALNGKFTVEKCERHKIDWTAVLLRQKSGAMKFTFKEGCDLEGSILPAVYLPFPIDMKLKNLEEFTKLVSQARVTNSFEARPVLLLELFEGQLLNPKGAVKFEADYRGRINAEGKLEENLGGELRITEIYGKKVNIKERIKVE